MDENEFLVHEAKLEVLVSKVAVNKNMVLGSLKELEMKWNKI